MKKIICLTLCCLPVIAWAQKSYTFSVINAQTAKPIPHLWYLLRGDTSKYIDAHTSDINGVCTFKLRTYDTAATYQVEINNQNNAVQSVLFDITDVIKKDMHPVLRIFPGPKAAPNPCGERMYGYYYPKSIFTLTDLPVTVQNKLKLYLTKRTGVQFYKRLILNMGQEIDLDKFIRKVPAAKNPEYNMPPTYSLCMSVLDTSMREEIYSFRIGLSKTGTLVDGIDLPDIKHFPAKANILSHEQVKIIADNNKVTNADIRAHYESKTGSIVWQVEKQDSYHPEGGDEPFTILRIDAHTGKILSRKAEVRNVMY